MRRVLFVINVEAGVGHDADLLARLRSTLKTSFPTATTIALKGHTAVTSAVRRFVRRGPAVIIAAGGGGTMRAVAEGVCLNGKPRRDVMVAALRMGSGNVLAKHFGVPKDPVKALAGIIKNIDKGRTVPCAVMRCDTTINGRLHTHVALTLAGFGQFGRVPGDLARFHNNHPHIHKSLAWTLGIERLTTLEYGTSLLLRSVGAALVPSLCERVQVIHGKNKRTLRLFSGALLNFPIKQLPFSPGIRARDPVLSLQLLPLHRAIAPFLVVAPRVFAADAEQITIGAHDTVTITLLDRKQADFFLDEDPLTFYGALTLRVGGLLHFVPGPEYRT